VNKRDLILNAIIQEYLSSKEPIGSMELKLKLNISISPSTIRLYLKKLSQEGALAQLHVSSGRIPTVGALIEYWKSKIDTSNVLEIGSVEVIKDAIDEYEIYCLATKSKKDWLKEIINVDNRYLILTFDEHEVVLKYNGKVEKFLTGLVGLEIRELKSIASQVGLYDLHKKLSDLISSSEILKAGESELYEIAKKIRDKKFLEYLLDYEFTLNLSDGIYFDGFVPRGCLAFKQPAKIDDQSAELFCFGSVQSDFSSFLYKLCNEGDKES